MVHWKNKGRQSIHITTVNGPVLIHRRVFWANQHGCSAPLDSWFGVSDGYSQGIKEMVCRVGLNSSYRKAADDLFRLSQVQVSYQSLRKVFQCEGRKVRAAQRTGEMAPSFTAEQCRAREGEPTCLITGADGFHVPLITEAEQRRRREKTHQRRTQLRRKGHKLKPLPPRPRGADQRWKEAKLVTFYDTSGRHQHTAATTSDHNALGRIMRREAARLHLDKADRKHSVSDGAAWIERQYRLQLPMLDAMILDYYHFREHTIVCAKALFGEGAQDARNWRKGFCQTMITLGPIEALAELSILLKRHRGRKRNAIKSLQGYIARRMEMLDYPRYLAEGLQIGSGPTEAQCKSMTARLKGRGRRWNHNAVDAHLAISCLYGNTGQWNARWPKAS